MLAIAPAGAATVGVALARLAGPAWERELIGLTAALVLLRVLRSRLTPVVSAAVLPVLFDIRPWSFVAAVAVIGGCLAVIAILDRPLADSASANCPVRPQARGRGWALRGSGSAPARPTVVGWMLVSAWIVIAGPGLGLPAAPLAPPLFVSALEWLARSGRTAALGVGQWTVTVGAAAVGMGLTVAVHPEWLAGIVAVTVMLALLVALSIPHPPALAVALIPQVAGAGHPLRFVAAVAVGAALLYTAASLAHRLVLARWGTPSAARPRNVRRPGIRVLALAVFVLPRRSRRPSVPEESET